MSYQPLDQGPRLLIDENLSEALLAPLADLFPASLHVRRLGFGGAPDQQIWALAREHRCVLLTRDHDFLQLSIVQGAPPKVIILAVGNCSNQALVWLLQTRQKEIRSFVEDEEAAVLVLSEGFGAPPQA